MTTGKDLARQLGVARSTLSEATKKGYLVSGKYDVQEWAEFGPNGRVRGYSVPPEVGLGQQPSPPNSAREQPDQANQANEDRFNKLPEFFTDVQDKLDELDEQRSNPEQAGTTSLLPPGEDYHRTAAVGATGHALGKAIEHEDRTVKTVILSLIGGVGGYALTDGKPWGGLVGVLSAFAFSAWSEGILETAGEDRALEGSNLSAPVVRGDQRPVNGRAVSSSNRSSRQNAENPPASGYSSDRSDGLSVI